MTHERANNKASAFVVPENWTAEQANHVLDFLYSIAEAVWEVYEEGLTDIAIEELRRDAWLADVADEETSYGYDDLEHDHEHDYDDLEQDHDHHEHDLGSNV